MNMRDLQQLERLSSTAALGLWAEDVILALDRVARLHVSSEVDSELLRGAAAILDAARERSEEPLAISVSSKALAATDTALDVAESLAEGRSSEQTRATLEEVAGVLQEAADGALGDEPEQRINAALDFFSAVGRNQLAASNSLSGSNRGSRSWMAAPTTLSSF
jgi:hypothetical protein